MVGVHKVLFEFSHVGVGIVGGCFGTHAGTHTGTHTGTHAGSTYFKLQFNIYFFSGRIVSQCMRQSLLHRTTPALNNYIPRQSITLTGAINGRIYGPGMYQI